MPFTVWAGMEMIPAHVKDVDCAIFELHSDARVVRVKINSP